MATLTKSVAETSGSKSTWTLTLSAMQDVTITTNYLQNLTLPNLSAKYSAISGKNGCYIDVTAGLYIGSTGVGSCSYASGNNVKLAGNTAKTLTPQSGSFSASNIFSSQNPTARSVPVLFKSSRIQLMSGKYMSYYEFEDPFGSCDLLTQTSWGTLFSIILNAPPTFAATNAKSDTNGFFAGKSTASVTVSSCSAKYGGNITASKLTIGNQSVTGTGNGVLSIKLSTAGTFIPTVTVTDSRGQTTTKQLEAITVNPYVVPLVTIQSAERVVEGGIPDDEGTSAVITASFSYTNAITDLLPPEVSIDGVKQDDEFCTWYLERAADGRLSNPVEWTDYRSASPVVLYGFLPGVFNRNLSYRIGIAPKDEYETGMEITQTLPQAYYTIDVYAGGHGIAFGAPATDEGFKVAMPAIFTDSVVFQRMAGAIQMFAGSSAPEGWLLCRGQAVSREDYSALFAVIGTTYGAGDGSMTFNLPDLRDRFPVGAGSSYAINGKGGANTVTLTTSQIPAHTHGKSGAITNGITGGSHSHSMNKIWSDGTGSSSAYKMTTDRTLTTRNTAAQTHTHNLPAHEHTSVGGGQAHENRPPYIGINFIICTGEAE